MQVINIITIDRRFGLERNEALSTESPDGLLTSGPFAGRSLNAVAEQLFLEECHRVDERVPTDRTLYSNPDIDTVHLPDIEGGFFETKLKMVRLNWATVR